MSKDDWENECWWRKFVALFYAVSIHVFFLKNDCTLCGTWTIMTNELFYIPYHYRVCDNRRRSSYSVLEIEWFIFVGGPTETIVKSSRSDNLLLLLFFINNRSISYNFFWSVFSLFAAVYLYCAIVGLFR